MPKIPSAPSLRRSKRAAKTARKPRASSPSSVNLKPWPPLVRLDMQRQHPSGSAGAVPSWVRNSWTGTSFGIPNYVGDTLMSHQATWAAKNSSVTIHDMFMYMGGDWSCVLEPQLCVYLAVCDVVLQRKDQEMMSRVYDPLPTYSAWRERRAKDFAEVFALAQRDFSASVPGLDVGAARSLFAQVIHELFLEGADACWPLTNEPYTLTRSQLGCFAPHPEDMDRYGLVIYSFNVGNERNEGAVNDELEDFESFRPAFEAVAGLRGLPCFPPGFRLTTPNVSKGVTVTTSAQCMLPIGPPPTLQELWGDDW
ncbi:hypothetical protein CC85DRAFT_305172 [Cutaneotrichosporon oleaginosum]|uniref:Uncharacterized protein n=1 Tax=Cutaneotrichosporon oleaginosum TaxID=879819 RepID=A0A0J0XE33_9TREE|nr:uncharacterized protein CC85DRAFT_305172 [Cutaneotrichosporon oleaginosum]KLT39268.1 hypothetical protein CC85DRAFT_305172 [Cutaneotrichosporon oleaginosum]TXT05899.1 hypothetical protein COLE_07219 [Cutaneotrichosporon oleaginosum]